MEKKMTKKDFYNLIKTEMSDNQAVVDFCNHEIELLDKKRTNGNKKGNEQVNKTMEIVYNALVSVGRPITATELIATNLLNDIKNDLGMITTQKVSAYLNKLVAENKVEKFVEKKKTYFKIVETDTEE